MEEIEKITKKMLKKFYSCWGGKKDSDYALGYKHALEDLNREWKKFGVEKLLGDKLEVLRDCVPDHECEFEARITGHIENIYYILEKLKELLAIREE